MGGGGVGARSGTTPRLAGILPLQQLPQFPGTKRRLPGRTKRDFSSASSVAPQQVAGTTCCRRRDG
jgi:hypothetical protein